MAGTQAITRLFVTYVDVESKFCMVWGHANKTAKSHIDQLIKNYSVHFDNGLGVVSDPTQLHKGMVCIGKVDSTYHRVQVFSVSSNEVQVFLIDYGYPITLKLPNLYLITLPKESNFLAVQPLCTKYVIARVLMIAGKETEALNWIRPYLLNAEAEVIIHDVDINAIDLYFYVNEKPYNVAQSLAHKQFSTSTPLEQFALLYQNFLAAPSSTSAPPNLRSNMMVPPPSQPLMNPAAPVWEKQAPYRMTGVLKPSQPLAAPAPMVSSMRQGPQTQTDPLLEGHVYRVVTTCIDEDDMTLVVHKEDESSSTLVNVISQINALPPVLYDKVLEPGAYVLAREKPGAPRLRAVLYRLTVDLPNKSEEHVEVYFVDFGHKAVVPVSEIYSMPPEFENLKSFAHRCHLANLELAKPWSKEVMDELKSLILDKVLSMKVLPSPLKTKRSVALYTENNENIVDLLLQELKPLMFESVHIPKGQSVEVIISHSVNASKFFVQLMSNQAALDMLMEQIQEHCEPFLKDSANHFPFTDGQLMAGNIACLAKFADDGRWYRGIIMDYQQPGSVTVRYVDYGNQSVLTRQDILAIPRHLTKVRTQAVECSLASHSDRRESDIEEDQFAALLEAHAYTFLMTIKMQLLGSVLMVELWDLTSKSSIRQILQTMVAEAQKAPKSVKAPPAASTEPLCSHTEAPPPMKNSFQRQTTRDKYSSDESDTGSRGGRPKLGADSSDWRRKRDEDSGGEGRKHRGGGGRFNAGDKSGGFGDKSGGFGHKSGGFGDKSGGFGENSRFGDKSGRFDKSGGFDDRSGGFDDRSGGFGDRGDGNDRGGGAKRGSNAEDSKWGTENTFRSGGKGPRDERGGRDGGGFKKREDFSKDSWGPAKGFESNSSSFKDPPKKPQLLDGYPGGSKVPTLPAVGALESPRLVSVTHFESPLLFYVQLHHDPQGNFIQFMNGLQIDYIKRKPVNSHELSVGQHVMALFTQDRCLYRAEVSQTSPEIKVKFFDYGNEASVPANKVWNIASEHCALPMQSILCKLSNIEIGETANLLDCVQYFSDDQYEMIIKGYDENNKAEVDLITKDSGVHVSTRLVEAGLAIASHVTTQVTVEDPIHMPLLLNQTVSIHLSFIESTRKFFVHLEPDKPEAIAAKIAEVITKPEENFPLSVEEIGVGKFVLATPDSEVWYRARVLAIPEGEVSQFSVLFIDYGDKAQVGLEAILDIPESLCNWSPQAFQCCLCSLSDDGLDEALESEFAKTWIDVNASLIVTEVVDKRLTVLLYNETGELQVKFHPTLPDNVKAPSAISPLCPYPVLRQGEKVFISHASSDALFIQNVSNETNQTEFATDILNYYSTTELPVLENPPQVGDIVAAKSVAFDAWYRSRVHVIEPDGQINVYYVDYGNSETIPASNLRALDATHFYPPAYCLKVTLPGTFIKDSYEIFVDVPDTFDTVYARGEDSQGWVVDLIGVQGSLLEKHSLAGQLEVAPSHPFAEKPSVLDRWLALGTAPVTVMSFASPGELSISLVEDETVQDELQARLQEFAHGTLPILGECQELCLGKYPENGQWYRARVLDAEFRALYVDYGNQDVVPEIRKLDYELRNMPALSVQCTLALVPAQGDQWSEEAVDRLDALVTEKTPSGRIMNYDSVPSIELIVDGKSVADLLVEEKLALRKSYKVVITHVTSVEELYVQYVDSATLDEVYVVMETIESNATLEPGLVEVGDLLAAKYTLDDAWYRARVVKKEAEAGENGQSAINVDVVFVDFGNGAQASEFRRLPSRVAKLPPLAKPCKLALPDGENWPETAKPKLDKLAQEGAAEFELKWLDYGGQIVEMTDGKGMNIVDVLLEPPPLKNYLLSHINSANDFYLQEENDANNNTIMDLLAAFDAVPTLDSVPIEELFAAKFVDDEAWYRAKVVTTEPTLKVLFVDYGNTSPASEFKALNDALKGYPPCAIHCSLATDTKLCEQFSQAANDKFIELSAGGETVYTADFLPEVDGRRPACLYIGTECVADLLAGLSDVETYAAVEAQETVAKTQNAEATPDESVMEKSNKVLISWVNSVEDFYVQKVADPRLDTIANALEKISEAPPIKVKVGDVVAALFVDDELWYRSRVLNDSEGFVHFIDYGNSSTATDFRALPPSLSLNVMPPCARKCKLDVSVSADSTEATDVLNAWAEKDVQMEVLNEAEGVCTVELRSGGERLSEVIVGGDTAIETENEKFSDALESLLTPLSLNRESSPGKESLDRQPVPSKVSSSKESSPSRQSLKEKARSAEAQKVHLITHVNSPSDFYLMTDAEASISIGTRLNKASEFEPVHSVIMGGTYAAFNEREDSWHRAKLIELLEDDSGDCESFLVKYVDFGNTDIVSKDGLRELPEDVREMPNVVQNCALETGKEFVDWSEAAERRLKDLADSGQFYVEDLHDGTPATVILLTRDGVNVNEMLLKIQAESKGEGDETIFMEDANETLNDTIISEVPTKELAGETVVVSHYASASAFHVQVVKDANILESVNSLLETCKDAPPSQVKVDELYAAKIGNRWFRVKVMWDKSEQETKMVQRVDYGDKVLCSEFKILSEDLSHIGAMAHACKTQDDEQCARNLAQWKEGQVELRVCEVGATQPLTVVLAEVDSNGVDVSPDLSTDDKLEDAHSTRKCVSNGTADSPGKEEVKPVKAVTSETPSLDEDNRLEVSLD